MKLFYASASPFVRKVMVAILETGQSDAVDIIDVTLTPLAPSDAVVQHNPLGKIPCMVLENGKTLHDSRVICRYLDKDNILYPEGDALWDTLTLEASADGILDSAVFMVYEARLREAAMQSTELLDAHWQKIAQTLDDLEQNRMGQLSGKPDMAVFAIGAALGYLDFRLAARDWRRGHPKLTAWEAEFIKRPAMAATIPVLPK